jgi:hypothetical protein
MGINSMFGQRKAGHTPPRKMADFRIWGKVEQIPPAEFFVIASAVPKDGGDGAAVLTTTASTEDLADSAKQKLMREVGALLRARGDRVVDVED